jgi:hypothetical protein
MTRLTLLTILVASFGAACTDDTNSGDENPTNLPPEGSTSGTESQTFDHDNSGFDPWAVIERLAKEGPPTFTARVHSCPKVRYRSFGTVLASLGVNMANTTVDSPPDLYKTGANAMGQASFANRIRENIAITTSGASREFDIFAAAAPEIIAAVPNLARCKDASGTAALLFDGNSCRADGITCLIGVPAQPAHVDFCNLTVTNASSIDVGKRIAVAALLAAAYTCE